MKAEINQAQIYYFDKKTKQKKSRNTVVKRTFQFIPRADDESKEIAVKAANLMETLDSMFGKDEVIHVNHEFLSTITRVDRKQNNRLLKQISHVFHYTYRYSVMDKGKKRREVLEIKRTENSRQIIDNPEDFFSKKEQFREAKNVSMTGQKCLDDGSKMSRPIYNDNIDNNRYTNDYHDNQEIISSDFGGLIINQESVTSPQQEDGFMGCSSSTKLLAEKIVSTGTTTFKDEIPRTQVKGKDGKMYSAIPLKSFKFDEQALDEIIFVSDRGEFNYQDVVQVVQNIIKKQPDKLIYGGRQGFIRYMIMALENEYGVKKGKQDNKTNSSEYMKQIKVDAITSQLAQGNQIKWM